MCYFFIHFVCYGLSHSCGIALLSMLVIVMLQYLYNNDLWYWNWSVNCEWANTFSSHSFANCCFFNCFLFVLCNGCQFSANNLLVYCCLLLSYSVTVINIITFVANTVCFDFSNPFGIYTVITLKMSSSWGVDNFVWKHVHH